MASEAAAFGPRTRSGALAIGLAIVALAAIPRFVGLEVGRVLVAAHPDEFPVAVAQWLLRTGQPSLQLVAYGGGFHVPLQLVLCALHAIGVETVFDATPNITPETMHDQLLPLRIYSACLGTATIALTFRAGSAVAGTAGGVIAALILAAAPAAIRDAHLAKADAAATFAAALVIAALARRGRRPEPTAIGLAAACGLALSTKYLVGLAPAAAFASWRGPLADGERARWRRLLLFAGVTAATIVALNGFWLIAPGECWKLFREFVGSHLRYVHSPWLVDSVRSPLEYHTMVSLRYGCGWLALVLTGPALVAALLRPGATRERVVAIAVLGQLAALAMNPAVYSRNLTPILPGIAVLIGALVMRLADRVPSTCRRPVLAIAVAWLVASPGYDGLRMARVMREMDTRGLAATWIAANVPREAAIVGFGGPPRVDWGLPDVGGRKLYRGLNPSDWSDAADFVVHYRYPIAWASRELPREVALGAPLVVFDPFAPGADPVVEPLDAFYLPLARFAGVERPGPRIAIYALAPARGASR